MPSALAKGTRIMIALMIVVSILPSGALAGTPDPGIDRTQPEVRTEISNVSTSTTTASNPSQEWTQTVGDSAKNIPDYDSSRNRIYTWGNGTAKALNATTGSVEWTQEINYGSPWFATYDDGADQIYVTDDSSGNAIKVLSPDDGTVLNTINEDNIRDIAVNQSSNNFYLQDPVDNQMHVRAPDGSLLDSGGTNTYYGAMDFDEQNDLAVYAPYNGDFIKARDSSNYNLQWEADIGGFSGGFDVQSHNGYSYVGNKNGELIKLDGGGNIVWRTNVSVDGSIVSKTQAIDVNEETGMIYAGGWNSTTALVVGVASNGTRLDEFAWDGHTKLEGIESVDEGGTTSLYLDDGNGNAAKYSGFDSYTTSAVSGTVEKPDGTAVDGATVEVVDSSTGSQVTTTTTGSSGGYTVDLEDGDYTIEASKDGFVTNSTTVSVSGSDITGADIVLRRSVVEGYVEDSNGNPCVNCTVEVIGVNNETLTVETGETNISAADDELDQDVDPTPPSYDPEVSLLGSGGVVDESTGEYATLDTREDWGFEGYTDDTNLGSPELNPDAREALVLTAWDSSKGGIQGPIDRQRLGASVKREVTVTRLDPADDEIDSRTYTLDRTYDVVGWGDKAYKEIYLQPGYYRLSVEGSDFESPPVKVGDDSEIVDQIPTDVTDVNGNATEATNVVTEKIQNETYIRRTATTNENGRYSVTMPENVGRVAVTSYKIDGTVLPSKQNATPTDMRRHIANNDYNGSVAMTLEPYRYVSPTSDANVTVRKFDSPPYSLLDEWANRWSAFRDRLESGDLTDVSDVYSVPLSELSDSELNDLASNLSKLADSNNDELIAEWEEQREEEWAAFQQELQNDERRTDELKDDIRALESTIGELESKLEGEEPDVSTSNGNVTVRQAFDRPGEYGSDLSEDDVIATWNDFNGSTSTIPDEYVSVNNRIGRNDEVVVEEYPIPNGSAGGNVAIMAVDGAGALGEGGAQVENPAFDGTIPEIRSVDVSTFRPGANEVVELDPNVETAGASLSKVEVYDDSGNQVNTTLENGKATFTPATSGEYFARLTFDMADSDEPFVESVRLPVGESSYNFPESVKVEEGRSGVFALAGAKVDDAKVSFSGSGGEIAVTALVKPDQGTNEVHYHLENAPRSADQEINVRVAEGESIETSTSATRHVGVYLHGRDVDDDAVIYRHGKNGKTPIALDAETKAGKIVDGDSGGKVIHTYTGSNGETTITINNDPGWIESTRYDLSVWWRTTDVGVGFAAPGFPVDALDVVATLLDLLDVLVDGLLDLSSSSGGVSAGVDPASTAPVTGVTA